MTYLLFNIGTELKNYNHMVSSRLTYLLNYIGTDHEPKTRTGYINADFNAARNIAKSTLLLDEEVTKKRIEAVSYTHLKSIIGQIDPETDTLYSLSDNKASAAELFVDLFTKRKETYTHMASVMDHIIQIILKDGGIDN